MNDTTHFTTPRIVNTTDATPDDLRGFIRDNLSKLPTNVQLEIMYAIKEATDNGLNEHSAFNHGALCIDLALDAVARAAQAGRSAV